jgi:hypothetical protein
MDELTNIQRIEHMLYDICGCTPKQGLIILKKCMERAEIKSKTPPWDKSKI